MKQGTQISKTNSVINVSYVFKRNMTAEPDRIEIFHNNTLPSNITANFSSSLYCHNRQFDNQFVLMCQSFWEKVSVWFLGLQEKHY